MIKRHLLKIGIIQLLTCFILIACAKNEEKTNIAEVITMEMVRIYEIPDCKMVSSGIGMFGEQKFENFPKWFSSLPATIFPRDFLFEEKGGLHWVIKYEPTMDVPKEFDIIDFKGGLYAVCCDIDQKTDTEAMIKIKKDFLDPLGYEIDNSRPEMGHIIGTASTHAILKYEQMDYWTPIKLK